MANLKNNIAAEKDAAQTKELDRGLKNRHVQLISIGGAIGTGLFLGSGKSIQAAGPSILLSYLIMGCICFLIMRALGELLLSNLEHHSFLEFIEDHLGKKAAFVTGWTYWFCWISIAMADLTATGLYIRYWAPGIPQWLPEVIALVILLSLNLMAVRLFGEMEFWFALIKVVAIVALIVVGVYMIVTGYHTNAGSAGFSHLWTHGGFFPKGFSGFLASFQMAAFAFVGIELVGLIAGETQDPETVIPKAINNIPIRIILFYLGSLTVIMSIYPWDSLNAAHSPFVEVFSEIGITVAASVINVVVLSSAASACNSALYSTGRMLRSLAKENSAPSFFLKLTRHQVPGSAILFSAATIFTVILLNYFVPSEAFTLITGVSTVCFLFIWFMMVYTHLRYRKTAETLHSFRMPLYPFSDYLVMGSILVLVGILFWEKSTRMIMLLTPFWFIALLAVYHFKYERAAALEYSKD